MTRLARQSHTLKDNWDDRIPTLMGEAGFSDATATGQLTKHIGRLTYYRATPRTEPPLLEQPFRTVHRAGDGGGA